MPLWAHPTSRSIHPEGCPGFCFARQGRGCRQSAPRRPPARNSPRPHNRLAQHARRESLPSARHVHWKLLLARTTRPQEIPPFRTTRPPGIPPSARHTNFSLPHDKAPATPDSADAAEGRFTASFCRFTDRADSPLPEQPCSIWDFSYLCTLPSHEPHFSSP